jgi:kynurenine formamidase
MQRLILAIAALVGGIALNGLIELAELRTTQAALQPTATNTVGFESLASGKLKIIDLSWPLNAKNAYWPGDNYKPFELHTIATLERDGVLSKAFSSHEHLGTHLDAPNHFQRDGASVDQIPPSQLLGPGVMIDVSAAAAADADYLVKVADIEQFETRNGPIPSGAIVLVNTGWGRFWDNPDRYQGKDVMGRLHFPGFSAEAARFLVDQRQARGIGLDTMSVDYGLSRDFAVHHVLGRAGRYGLENLARLETLPPRGFYLFVAPIKIEGGSGGPARVFAIEAEPSASQGR